VLRHLLAPLLSHPEGGVFTALCADGNHRRCYAPVSVWHADYPEHCDLQNLRHGSCIWYECPADEVGDYRPPHDHHPTRNHRRYAAWDAAQNVASLASRGAHAGEVALRDLLGSALVDLPKPDLLHTMHLGMLKHLMEWLQSFLKDHRGIFNRAILCTRALLEFFFYASYTSHDQATLDLMENALRRFHEHKDVFRQYRAGKRITTDARELRTELIKQREAALTQRRLEGLSPAALRDERHSWNAFIDAEVVDCAEDGAHWNFPKLHLMLHFRDQVRRFGSLGQWSTEIGESSHRRQIKDGYNAGNRAGDVYLQIINHYLRLDAFTVRAMNNQAWRAKHDPQRVVPASPGVSLPPTVAAATSAASTTAAAATAVTTAGAASTATTAAASTITADAASTPVSGPPARLHFVSPQLTTGPGKVTTLGGVFANLWTPAFREAIHDAMRSYLHSQRVLLPDSSSSHAVRPSTTVWMSPPTTCMAPRWSSVSAALAIAGGIPAPRGTIGFGCAW
jgi:hypothetical protein